MFEYYKGYEIDGSDTYYSLKTPNFEKVKEMITYVLNLKVIDKNTPFVIKKASKNKKYKNKYFGRREYFSSEDALEMVDREYTKDNLDDLFKDIYELNIDDFELQFMYVHLESLFPEVKREIIDMLVEERKDFKKYNFKNPVLTVIWEGFDRSLNRNSAECIGCSFYTQRTKRQDIDGDYHDITPKEKVEEYTKGSYFNLNFDVSTVMGGVQPLLGYYVLKKLEARFPEYKINALKSFNEVSSNKLNVNNYIFEALNIPVKDVKRVFESQLIDFIDTKEVLEDRRYRRYDVNIEKGNLILKLILNYEWLLDEDNLNALNYRHEYPLEQKMVKLIKNYYDPTTKYISVENYINLCEKLYELRYLTTNDIKKFTTSYFIFKETVNNIEGHQCKVRYIANEGEGFFEVIVPCEVRESFEGLISNTR